jgi:hypothetical protein
LPRDRSANLRSTPGLPVVEVPVRPLENQDWPVPIHRGPIVPVLLVGLKQKAQVVGFRIRASVGNSWFGT